MMYIYIYIYYIYTHIHIQVSFDPWIVPFWAIPPVGSVLPRWIPRSDSDLSLDQDVRVEPPVEVHLGPVEVPVGNSHGFWCVVP